MSAWIVEIDHFIIRSFRHIPWAMFEFDALNLKESKISVPPNKESSGNLKLDRHIPELKKNHNGKISNSNSSWNLEVEEQRLQSNTKRQLNLKESTLELHKSHHCQRGFSA